MEITLELKKKKKINSFSISCLTNLEIQFRENVKISFPKRICIFEIFNFVESTTQGAPAIASDSANSPSVFSVCYDVREVACRSVNKVPLTELIVPRWILLPIMELRRIFFSLISNKLETFWCEESWNIFQESKIIVSPRIDENLDAIYCNITKISTSWNQLNTVFT